jgi:hypothetical protein
MTLERRRQVEDVYQAARSAGCLFERTLEGRALDIHFPSRLLPYPSSSTFWHPSMEGSFPAERVIEVPRANGCKRLSDYKVFNQSVVVYRLVLLRFEDEMVRMSFGIHPDPSIKGRCPESELAISRNIFHDERARCQGG